MKKLREGGFVKGAGGVIPPLESPPPSIIPKSVAQRIGARILADMFARHRNGPDDE